MITMLNMDCMEYMAGLPDKAFDLAIVDPPYGIGAGKMTMGSGNHVFAKGKDWDSGVPNEQYFTELFRISKNQIIWGGNYFTEFLPVSRHWVLWDKKNPNLSFAEGELAWIRNGNNLRIFQCYSAMVEAGGKIHPTAKPIALYKWLLSRYAKPGDRILDTHGGSGSICIACHDLGYDLTWMELDKDYFDAACERYQRHASQEQLFDTAIYQPKQGSLI